MIYNVVWKITKSIGIDAKSEEEAAAILEYHRSIVYDGEYIDHSLEIIEVEELNL